nr:endopeptidase La [Bacilli bacterium]
MSENKQVLTLPLLITRGLIVFPGNQKVIEAGRNFSVFAIQAAKLEADSLIFITTQKSSVIESPTSDDLYNIGVLARIVSFTEREKSVKVRVEVIDRVEFTNLIFDEKNKYYVAQGTVLPLPSATDPKVNESYLEAINSQLESMPALMNNMPKSLLNNITKNPNLVDVIYSLGSFVDAPVEQKQELLEKDDIESLFTLVMIMIKGEETKNQIESTIAESVRESTEKSQKEYYLREKLKAIKKELGENVDDNSSPDNIIEKLEKNPYPENIKKKVKAELKKFEMMPNGSLEAALIQSYVDVLMNIPWYQKTTDNDDLHNVEKILDEDHYGLEIPKKRIVEYLAVKKLTGNLKSPILCFFGPPGTGKTSLGKSIARALGRKFFKASLGGISDEAEIRGHRRTYVGSMPGRIIQGMRKAGVTNPVFLLDEIDKVASSYKGDPASALLEVLDPEQNTAFNDNYVEEPYDLSDVLFICTANYLENIPGPLRDRLELIQLSSYTELEKVQIVKKHLIEKQKLINGLKPEQASFTDDAVTYIIRHYTRESGVRDLERKIASCLRKVAVAIVKDPHIEHIEIDSNKVREYLGV